MTNELVLRKKGGTPRAASPVAFHPHVRKLTLEQAAAHLGLTVDQFEYHRLFDRVPEPINGKYWRLDTLILKPSAAPPLDRLADVYVIKWTEFIKIGFSTDIRARLVGLQTALPTHLALLKIIEGAERKRERQLHRKFAEYRTQGEWFRHEGRLAAWIEGGCE